MDSEITVQEPAKSLSGKQECAGKFRKVWETQGPLKLTLCCPQITLKASVQMLESISSKPEQAK